MGAMLDDTVGPPAPPELVNVLLIWRDHPDGSKKTTTFSNVRYSYTVIGEAALLVISNLDGTDHVIPLSELAEWTVKAV